MSDYHPQGLWGTEELQCSEELKANTQKHVAVQILGSYWSVTILHSTLFIAQHYIHSVILPTEQKLNPKYD